MKRLKLGTRLLLGFLIVGLLPLASLAWYYLHTFENALSANVLQNLSSIADKKADQIRSYIDERLADARLYANHPGLREALRLYNEHDASSGGARLSMGHLHEEIAHLGERGNYYDVLLINAEGDVVFSLREGDELGTNLINGPYQDSNLATGLRHAVNFLQVDLTRFAHYPPSGNLAVAFAIAPVLEDGRVLGALALQIKLSTLMPVVADRTGLGHTGETVLAIREGDFVRYTAPLAKVPGEPFSVTRSMSELAPPMKLALAGEYGRGLTLDYVGEAIAASWRYLPALGWGMVVKIDRAEALAALHARQRTTILAFSIFLLVSALAALLLGRRFIRSESIIAAQEALYRGMFNSMNDGVVLYRPDETGTRFTILDINPAGEKITCVRRQNILGKHAGEVFPGLEASGILPAFRRVTRTGVVESVKLTRYQDSRLELWVENDVLRLPGGEILSVFKDVTERHRAEEALQLYANIFEHSGEAIMVTDHANRIIEVNPAFTRQTGYALEEIRGKNPRLLSSGRTPEETYQLMWTALQETGYWQGELWDRNRDGEVYPKWASISAIRDENDVLTHYIASFTDISERKAAEARIEHLAHHDSLTGLFNRYNLEIRLSQAVLSARREHECLAVMFIDLDRFKVINDTLGHQVGDLLLVEVAQRLRACIRESDIAARQGGDEFVVVLSAMSGPEDASNVASKILQTLSLPYQIGADVLHSTPSIGISVFPEDGEDAGTLMKNADTAMYHAKAQGRNNLQYFTAAMNDAANERLLLERELREAIDAGQLLLHYQPQFAANDTQETARPVAVEALVRWAHPERGLISPARFIPVAEETGLIIPIGDWVLREACRQLAEWKTLGIGPRRVAVNLSAHQLRNPDLVVSVASTMAQYGLSRDELELEITESVAMTDPEAAVEKLRALRDLGVTLAIDDFGTGYSSLAYLKRLPIQVLKLDREFVRDIEVDENDAAISAATLALAHSLGLQVVAEGIETPGQSQFLRQHGCDLLQGYLYGKPCPAAEWKRVWESAGQKDSLNG